MKIAAYIALLAIIGAAGGSAPNVLPNGWVLNAPTGTVVRTGTMPQAAALSPDGATLAIVEAGFNPPDLALYATGDLHLVRRVALAGAFGRPVWTPHGILVAGANANAIFVIDPARGSVRAIPLGRGTYPVAVAARGGVVAVATDLDASVRIGALGDLRGARAIRVGEHPGNMAFTGDGGALFVTVKSGRYIARVSVRDGTVRRIPTDLHPSDVLVVGGRLYVAQADADTVAAYDVASLRRLSDVFVGTVAGSIGSSPNSLSARGDSVFVTLGAANEVAVLRNGAVAARLPTGWYPTAAVAAGDRLLVVDGKGEGTKPNPDFDVFSHSNRGYIAATQFGSIRVVALNGGAPPNPQGAQYLGTRPADTIVNANGPIRHVFFILKENRTYDQILGDMPQGNGDAHLTFFGARVTPNQHALAQRFGLFDNFYTSGEVSDAGHNWADGAFANDYVERTWPPAYGDRNNNDYTVTGTGAGVPSGGYIWDAARRAGVTFRDYGELAQWPAIEGHVPTTAPSLGGRFDPRYVPWNLDYSDVDRYREWKREFDGFVATNSVPQFEFMWLPNDHTAGIRPGKLTPAAYIASNDYAVGLIVAAISHSSIWSSSAIFITEDDAQDGADHVSDQRSTLYLASPYARGGAIHEHYSTVSVLRTIELLLGMQPLSNYDATAMPLYTAFGATPNLAPFDATPPQIDLNARNARTAYGAAISERLDFSRPDANPPGVLGRLIDSAYRRR
ncbi:MAG TPA: alkaline phosphatase family protein [Candidatus Binatia bacterium]|nr:alkaline phosphatase family protein [Candidatus Binatia bacterium]